MNVYETLTATSFAAVLRGEIATAFSRDVIEADGVDTVKFLHSQLSQDIASMGAADVRWSFLLQPTGKLVGLLRVVRGDGDRFTLDTDPGSGQAVFDALSRFKIRTKCDLLLRADQVFGATWAEKLPVITADVASISFGEEVSALASIVRGFPAWGAELDDSTIPNATGVVGLAASFTKGCYTGQELVERIDSRGGNVPRRLVGLDFSGLTTADRGTSLNASGHVVGTVTRVATDPRTALSVALAYVKREVLDGAEIQDGSGLTAEVRDLS